jgi:hypothetical protein
MIGGHTNRRSWLAPQGFGRRVPHVDDVGRVDDPNVEGARIGVALQLSVNDIRAPDQIDAESQIARRGEGTLDRPRRRVIAAHGVYGNTHPNVEKLGASAAAAATRRLRSGSS